jgi:hypothetical protein
MKKPLKKTICLFALLLVFAAGNSSADQDRAQVQKRQNWQSQAATDTQGRPMKGQRRNLDGASQDLTNCQGQRRGQGRGRGQARGRGAGNGNSVTSDGEK